MLNAAVDRMLHALVRADYSFDESTSAKRPILPVFPRNTAVRGRKLAMVVIVASVSSFCNDA
jgi:hypothetical protein